MSQAEALLNSISEGEVAVRTVDPVTEPHIVVGADRVITVPDALRRIAVQFDHDVETVTFDCPRYWDGLDMSQMRIYINYRRPDKYKDAYLAKNVVPDENDPSIMHFEWTISRNVTEKDGILSFLVCIKKADEEDNEVNHWNSELNNQMYVSEGMECGDESILIEYPDYLATMEREYRASMDALKAELLGAKEAGEFDGFSPTISIATIEGGHRITVTDVEGGKAFDIMDGVDTHVKITTIEGGHTLTITDVDGSKAFDIMNGISPIVTVVQVTGGHRVTVTDAEGSKSFVILDGKDAVSPVVSVTEVEGGHRVSVTDVNETKTFDIMDAVSPVVTVDPIAGGHRITVTDVHGARSFDVTNGFDGEDGISSIVAVTEIEGGHKITITDAEGSKSFEVPNGVDGADGTDGVSPDIAVEKITDGYRVTITDANGTKSFDVMNGIDGTGAGDMVASRYDPQGKQTDIYQYVDDAVATAMNGIARAEDISV